MDEKSTYEKVKAHVKRNKSLYTKFGYYTLGVVASTYVHHLMAKRGIRIDSAIWKQANDKARQNYGSLAYAVRTQDGRFLFIEPIIK